LLCPLLNIKEACNTSLKQDKMTPNERWVALLNKQLLDRVPIVGGGLGFPGLNVGYTMWDMYTGPQKTFSTETWMAEQYGWQSIAILFQSFFREKSNKYPSGYILLPGCETLPKVPPEKIIAMTRAVNDFG